MTGSFSSCCGITCSRSGPLRCHLYIGCFRQQQLELTLNSWSSPVKVQTTAAREALITRTGNYLIEYLNYFLVNISVNNQSCIKSVSSLKHIYIYAKWTTMDLVLLKNSDIYGSSLIVGIHVLRTLQKLGKIILEPLGGGC